MRRLIFLILIAFLALAGCTSGLRERAAPSARGAHRTVVLFVVDGLAVPTLRAGLKDGRARNLRSFFLRGRDEFPVGQAAFPTLTYPNLTSILTTRPVGEHGVIANQVLAPSGRIIAFDDRKNFPRLRETVDPLTVIAALNEQGKETASFSYVLGRNATQHMRVGPREGLEYLDHDYRRLDERLLTSMAAFLRERGPQERWPELIYVHLVGVDAVSHRYGPASPETRAYLAWLDQRLGEVLSLLERAEARAHGNLITMLTADHGFVPVTRHVPLSRLVHKQDLGIVILNEGRFLGLHLPAGHAPTELAPLLREARAVPGVELTALREENTLEIARGARRWRFAVGAPVCEAAPVSLALLPPGSAEIPAASFRCPTEFENARGELPFLVSGLARFLSSPNHPDAVVLAGPGISFAAGMAGAHGGATAAEVLVPVLLRNATIDGTGPVRTSELLKLLRRPEL